MTREAAGYVNGELIFLTQKVFFDILKITKIQAWIIGKPFICSFLCSNRLPELLPSQ